MIHVLFWKGHFLQEVLYLETAGYLYSLGGTYFLDKIFCLEPTTGMEHVSHFSIRKTCPRAEANLATGDHYDMAKLLSIHF